MAILALLLTAVFSFICYFSWSNSYSDAHDLLQSAINDSAFDAGVVHVEAGVEPPFAEEGKPLRPQKRPVVEASVAVYSLGSEELLALKASRGLLSLKVQEEVYAYVKDAPDGMGDVSSLGLVYLKETVAGNEYVAFVDLSILDGWKSLALTLGIVEIAVLILFFFVSLGFSKWALSPVQDAWSKQRRFISDASHELKTPLSIVSANTNILLEEADMPEDERMQWLERSSKALENMQELIDQLLDLASIGEQSGADVRSNAHRTEGDKADPDGGKYNLSRLVEAAALQFEAVSFERGFSITESIEEGIEVAGNEKACAKIIDILVENACKYVDEGGLVKISVRNKGSDALVCVANTGSFITSDEADRVFDRFYRADKARSSGGGHGLGLAIAKDSAEKIGAQISVKSNSEMTVFTLRIPIG